MVGPDAPFSSSGRKGRFLCPSGRSLVRPPDGKQTSQIVIEKGEPQKFQFSFRLVLSKLRFMNWSEDLLTLSHILSKSLSMRGVNNENRMQRSS